MQEAVDASEMQAAVRSEKNHHHQEASDVYVRSTVSTDIQRYGTTALA